jgi:hypothetical protein
METRVARWLVKLEGERFDLEEFPKWFPDGDLLVTEEKGEFLLTGLSLDLLSDAEAVLNAAEAALVRLYAVASLLMPSLRPPRVAHVVREEDSGKRQAFSFMRGSVEARSNVSASAVLVRDGVPVEADPQTPTRAQMFLAAAEDKHLAHVLELWGNGVLTWPRLYRIIEAIESSVGCEIDEAGLCTRAERSRFTRSANTAEVSGLDSRHAAGQFQPPTNPMSLGQAQAFVRDVVVGALERTARKR